VYDSNNQVYTAAEDCSVHVWAAKEFSLICKWKCAEGPILCGFFHERLEKHRVMLGTPASSILITRIRKRDNTFWIDSKVAVKDASVISALEFVDAELWVGSEKQLIVLNSQKEYAVVAAWQAHTHRITGMAIAHAASGSTPQTVWTSSQDCSIRVWDTKSKKLLKTITRPLCPFTCLVPVRDTLWAGSWEKTILILKASEPFDLIRELKGKHKDAVMTLVEVVKSKDVWSGSTSKDDSMCIWRWL